MLAVLHAHLPLGPVHLQVALLVLAGGDEVVVVADRLRHGALPAEARGLLRAGAERGGEAGGALGVLAQDPAAVRAGAQGHGGLAHRLAILGYLIAGGEGLGRRGRGGGERQQGEGDGEQDAWVHEGRVCRRPTEPGVTASRVRPVAMARAAAVRPAARRPRPARGGAPRPAPPRPAADGAPAATGGGPMFPRRRRFRWPAAPGRSVGRRRVPR